MEGMIRDVRKTGVILAVGLLLAMLGLRVASQPVPELHSTKDAPVIGRHIADADEIRVGISDDRMTELEYHAAKLSATGPYVVIDQATGKTVADMGGGQETTITVDQNGFYLYRGGFGTGSGPHKGPIILQAKNPASRVIANHVTRRGQRPKYKGYFEVTRGYSSPKKLSVVNVVPIQEYLKAVVPNELPSRYGFEAVKAQSVAARNYAIRPREKLWPQFDICDSQYCQVYFGAHTEDAATNRALEQTYGLIALYDGDPVLALYSSAHGGYSENYENAFSDPKTHVFPGTPLPYLQGRPDIADTVKRFGDLSSEEAARAFWTAKNVPSYDVESSYHRWQKQWAGYELQSQLSRTLAEASSEKFTAPFVKPAFPKGQSTGEIRRIHVKQRGVSGKAMAIEIEAANGRWTVEKEFVIRKVFAHGGRMLPSANVVFSHLTDANGRLVALRAEGGGFGHGVGMSQLGASYLSKQGRPYKDIVQHYYKGVAIGTIPLLVGQGHHREPVRVTFHAPHAQGRLLVETDEPNQPVLLQVNGENKLLRPTEERSSMTLAGGLRPNQLNTLVLYPDEKNPKRNIKAWIELIEPRAEDAPKEMARADGTKKPAQVCLLNVCW